MQRLPIRFVLILLICSVSIQAKVLQKGLANETLLVGQIYGPSNGATRNLLGMLLAISVFCRNIPLHSSLIPITTSTFPFNYSIVLNDHDFGHERAENFSVISMIWQPAYISEVTIHAPEHEIETLNLTMLATKFVIIRGQIVHETRTITRDLPAKYAKLEVLAQNTSEIIDQVDFLCPTKKYPCPFEYWLDTSRMKANVDYKLEAILTNRILPIRKTGYDKHLNHSARTKSSKPATFRINSTIDTLINAFEIVVGDV